MEALAYQLVFARQTTFAGTICCASNVEGHSVAITSQHLTGNITSSILDALTAIGRLEPMITITNTTVPLTVFIIMRCDGSRSVMDVKH